MEGEQNRLERPIFQEVPDEIDESWTHGALLGGFASCGTDNLIARSYWESAELLVERGLADQEMWRYAAPACFLYRHAIELYLKCLSSSARRTHSLTNLIAEFDSFVRTELHQTLPDWVRQALEAFQTADPRGTAFRYSDEAVESLPGETWIDFHAMREVLKPILGAMDRLAESKRWHRLKTTGM